MNRAIMALFLTGWTLATMVPAVAQNPREPVAKAPAGPELLTLRASDGFPISATWFEGTGGKEAAAVIMLHDLERDSSDFTDLAAYFASNGHCVIVPDLRGHGKSKTDAAGNEFAPKRFLKGHLLAMQEDIETCKKFLIQKNDEEVCNIEYLMVIADGSTNLPALGWCIKDWSFLPTTTKNGQDVKGLVMLNPDRNYRGVTVNEALRAPLISGRGAANPLDIMIIVGTGNRDKLKDAKGFYSSVANMRGKRSGEDDSYEKHDLFLREINTSALHKEMFERNPKTAPEYTLDLLEFRILNQSEYAWKRRKGN